MERDGTANQFALPATSAPLLVAAEKNLEEIGFFSASSSTGPQATEKRVSWNRERDGKLMTIEVTILGRQFGLPNTWDLDLYRAWQHIIWSRYIRQDQPIPDPIPFTSPDLLLHARKEYGGKQGDAVYRWMQKMLLTGIASKGAVFDAGKGNWITTKTPRRGLTPKPERDLLFTLTVFRQVHQEGHEVQGIRASRNEVYLQDWYRANLERSFTKPVDVDLHFSLRRPLAKILMAILDVMLYAGDGRASKRYDDLCTLLGVPVRSHLSLVRQQMDPAFKELLELGFLSSWHYRRSKDESTWVVSWEAGPRWNTNAQLGTVIKNYLPRPQQPHEQLLPGFAAESTPVKAAPAPEIASGEDARAIELVKFFRDLLGHKRLAKPFGKEIEQARGLLAQHGPEVCRHIVRFAVEDMRRTNFRARWFGAVLRYTEEAVAQHRGKEEEARRSQERQAAATAAEVQAKVDREKKLTDALAALSASDAKALRDEVEQQLRSNPFVRPDEASSWEQLVQTGMRMTLQTRLGL